MSTPGEPWAPRSRCEPTYVGFAAEVARIRAQYASQGHPKLNTEHRDFCVSCMHVHDGLPEEPCMLRLNSRTCECPRTRRKGDPIVLEMNPALSDDPADGHRFTLSVHIGASTRVGDGPYEDTPNDSAMLGPPWTLTVRAWNLPDALRAAAEVDLNIWDRGER